MGCVQSKDREDAVEVLHISGPIAAGVGGPPRQVPTQPRDEFTGMPIPFGAGKMDAASLLRCLETTAASLGRSKKKITIITVGGAVNTLYLRSRNYTQDVDFFNAQLNRSDLSLISAVGREAWELELGNNIDIKRNWLNNAVTLLMGRNVMGVITRLALEQNIVVFEHQNLKVLAAPWQYALCTKLDRMSKDAERPYDITDAADYLHQYIEKHQVGPVSVSTVRQWSASFQTGYRDTDLEK